MVAVGADEGEALVEVEVPDPGAVALAVLDDARGGVAVANTNEETLKESGDTRFVPLVLAYRAAEKQAQQAQSLIESIVKPRAGDSERRILIVLSAEKILQRCAQGGQLLAAVALEALAENAVYRRVYGQQQSPAR